MLVLSGLFAIGLALIHSFSGGLRFLAVIPRSRLLSLASGASIAYVFVHILPELAKAQQALGDPGGLLGFVELHSYLLALLGLAVFFGLERAVKSSQRKPEKSTSSQLETPSSLGIFWLHIGSFAIYNTLIGYLLLHREEQGSLSLLFFFVAMSLHFFVNDYGLRHDHRATYNCWGRWVLAAAVIIGWGAGVFVELQEGVTKVLFAFLAGGIVLNVLKEELPDERQSRFWPFALGAAGYSLVLLVP